MDTVKKNANALNRNFTIMAAWWEGRGSADAFKMADMAAKASAKLRKAANDGDAAAAQAAMGEIRGSCKSCHTAHRVKNDDGSWGFKD
jgi:cytochrome c556